MQPVESDEAGPACKGMAFIMSMQLDPDDGPPTPFATPRRSPSQDSIGSHTLLRSSTQISRAASQASLTPSRSSSLSDLNFDTVTVYNDEQAAPSSAPVAAPAMQGNNSMVPRRGSDLKTPIPKGKLATPMVSPEKQTASVFKKTDVKPVVHLIGKTPPTPVGPAKKAMNRKPVVKAGGPVVKAVKPKGKSKGKAARKTSNQVYGCGCSRCRYRVYGSPCDNGVCVKKEKDSE